VLNGHASISPRVIAISAHNDWRKGRIPTHLPSFAI